MDVVLHIGVNKTGTSSLQYWLWHNREALAARGIAYPDFGIETAAHHELSRMIKRASGEAELDAIGAGLVGACQGLPRAIVSSENFHTLDDGAVAAAARVFPRGRTRVIVYVRDPVAYVASWYQQAVQSRPVTMTLPDFARFHYASQDAVIARWQAVYGAERVVARVFDRESLVGRTIVDDFAATALDGLDVSGFQSTPDKNISISGNLLFLKRLLNVFLTEQDARDMAHEVGAMAARKPRWSGRLEVDEETVRQLRRITRTDREALLARGLALPDPPRRIAGNAAPDPLTLNEDLGEMVMHLARKGGNSPTWDRLGPILPLMSVRLQAALRAAERAADRRAGRARA